MKRFLLATSALALVGGVASADDMGGGVAISGGASMGISYDGTDMVFDHDLDLTFSASTTTDNGLTISAGVSIDNDEEGVNGVTGETELSGLSTTVTEASTLNDDTMATNSLIGTTVLKSTNAREDGGNSVMSSELARVASSADAITDDQLNAARMALDEYCQLNHADKGLASIIAMAQPNESGSFGTLTFDDDGDKETEEVTFNSVIMDTVSDGGKVLLSCEYNVAADVTEGTIAESTSVAVNHDMAKGELEGGTGTLDLVAHVTIGGEFGSLRVGDITAADKLAGGLSDIGGADNVAEAVYGGSSGEARFDATFGSSAMAVSFNADGDWAAGMSYSSDQVNFGAGIDSNDTTSVGLGFTGAGISSNLLYSMGADDASAYGLEVGYSIGDASFTTIYAGGQDSMGASTEAFAIGIGYDLGGGASFSSHVGEANGESEASISVSMSF